ncbi:MAG: chaperone modulator CbpM [Verrucomicrobiia bacterium]|jgi:DNA-binding transcriptional MerR regulator
MNGSSSSRLTIVRLHIHSPAHEALYDLETLARLARMHPAHVSNYVRLGLLDPVAGEGHDEHAWRFDDGSLHILRRIQRLRSELGININGVAVVLELLRQIDDLQRDLAHPPDEQ